MKLTDIDLMAARKARIDAMEKKYRDVELAKTHIEVLNAHFEYGQTLHGIFDWLFKQNEQDSSTQVSNPE